MRGSFRPATLSLVVLLLGCHSRSERGEPTLPTVPVQTIAARTQRTPDVYETIGTVQAKDSTTVAAKIMAVIVTVHVKVGDTVTAGQPLATLDDRDSQAEFSRAKADYARFQTLLEQQAATRAEFEAVEARYRAAEAASSYAHLLSPLAGVITQKNCEAGDMTMPGQPLFVIEKPGRFRLHAEVPERHAAALVAGQKTYVLIESTGEKCEGTISEIVPAADPATRSVLAKIELQCRQPLRSGLFGRAKLIFGERFAMFVPKAAVHERGQLTYVWIAADHTAQLRLVKTGKQYLDGIELLAGVQDGERVIVSAEKEIQEGQPVADPVSSPLGGED